jgi:hypothetical protein
MPADVYSAKSRVEMKCSECKQAKVAGRCVHVAHHKQIAIMPSFIRLADGHIGQGELATEEEGRQKGGKGERRFAIGRNRTRDDLPSQETSLFTPTNDRQRSVHVTTNVCKTHLRAQQRPPSEWGLVRDTSACYHRLRPEKSVALRARAGATWGLGGYPLTFLSPSCPSDPLALRKLFSPSLTRRRHRRWMTRSRYFNKNFALEPLGAAARTRPQEVGSEGCGCGDTG